MNMGVARLSPDHRLCFAAIMRTVATPPTPNQRHFMDSLFRTRKVEPTDGADARADGGGNADRPLRALLAASLILPILIFTGVSWTAYHRHFQDARERLETTLGVIHEHALKVFETFELTARYTDELFADVSDEQMIASEAHYHERLKGLVDTLPQLRDIWVIDRAGRPLVSGTIFPMPLDLSTTDRDFFAFHRDNATSTVFISEVIQSRAVDRRVIVIARRRLDPAGVDTFNGIMTTAIAPEYFKDYYATLPLRQNSFAALMREDGTILARHPDLGRRPARLMPETPIFAAIAASPQSGFVSASSPFDTVERMVGYRRLPRHGIYVISGVESRMIIHDWMQAMFGQLLFGVPATVTMVVLAWIALRRTRRESMAYARLHQEVAQRELTEHALRQSQKMEAVGRLTGGIAHDFNNLLTAILGNVDLAVLRLRQPDERVQRNLASARDAAQRAVSLINRLLAYSRQHPLEVKTVDLNRLVQGMSDLVRRAIGETIVIETILAAGVWKTSIDPNQLESAILNLAVNAKDAMPDGGRLIIQTSNTTLADVDVAAHEDLAPGPYVVLTVSDTGTGMSQDVIDHAFEPFFTTKPTGMGTGLGLSMVYGFVKQSRGHVSIGSAPGRGTSVKLYFPRSKERRERSGRAAHAPDAPRLMGLSTETVLVVEDDEEVQRFATEVLSDAGYRVLMARDGASALKLIERHAEIALLFTDVVLPGGMNGRQLAAAALARRPGLKVLYATGYWRNAVMHRDRLEPDTEVLTKPFTYETLTRKVSQLIGNDAAAAPPQTGTG
jgi:two-component system NtrC family sensor kinase